ncbi:hypothetical protein ALC53_00592 [Atta colombica]|uniref:Uncharacterized protein n=1 Tax=Atta colombica TaxID=520822 RepID=A0A195BYP5_9HYME|nr:hypothetical protein ALC53_00592 [Atta colombica]
MRCDTIVYSVSGAIENSKNLCLHNMFNRCHKMFDVDTFTVLGKPNKLASIELVELRILKYVRSFVPRKLIRRKPFPSILKKKRDSLSSIVNINASAFPRDRLYRTSLEYTFGSCMSKSTYVSSSCREHGESGIGKESNRSRSRENPKKSVRIDASLAEGCITWINS